MAGEKPKKLKRLKPRSQAGSDAIRILYVEDATVIRDTIAKLLELKGYNVNYAKNGQEGVEKAISWNPDIVLMDLRMPVMDGYNAINKIKMNPKTKNLPIFVVSAWSSKKERTQANIAGADEFFVKPPDLAKLTATIEEYVKRSKS